MSKRARRTPGDSNWLRSEARFGTAAMTDPTPWVPSPRFKRVKMLTPEEIAKAFPGVPISRARRR